MDDEKVYEEIEDLQRRVAGADAPQKKKRKRGGIIPALLNIVGTLILLSVLVSCLPVAIPKLMGYGVYNVVSGSMAPEIPVGSAVYVKETPPEEIAEGEVIAFWSGDSVVVHRVVKNQVVEGEFTTKGDANAGEDLNSVAYSDLIGRVTNHFPVIGSLMVLYTGNVGKVYVICFAVCGLMMNLLAGRIRESRR